MEGESTLRWRDTGKVQRNMNFKVRKENFESRDIQYGDSERRGLPSVIGEVLVLILI